MDKNFSLMSMDVLLPLLSLAQPGGGGGDGPRSSAAAAAALQMQQQQLRLMAQASLPPRQTSRPKPRASLSCSSLMASRKDQQQQRGGMPPPPRASTAGWPGGGSDAAPRAAAAAALLQRGKADAAQDSSAIITAELTASNWASQEAAAGDAPGGQMSSYVRRTPRHTAVNLDTGSSHTGGFGSFGATTSTPSPALLSRHGSSPPAGVSGAATLQQQQQQQWSGFQQQQQRFDADQGPAAAFLGRSGSMPGALPASSSHDAGDGSPHAALERGGSSNAAQQQPLSKPVRRVRWSGDDPSDCPQLGAARNGSSPETPPTHIQALLLQRAGSTPPYALHAQGSGVVGSRLPGSSSGSLAPARSSSPGLPGGAATNAYMGLHIPSSGSGAAGGGAGGGAMMGRGSHPPDAAVAAALAASAASAAVRQAAAAVDVEMQLVLHLEQQTQQRMRLQAAARAAVAKAALAAAAARGAPRDPPPGAGALSAPASPTAAASYWQQASPFDSGSSESGSQPARTGSAESSASMPTDSNDTLLFSEGSAASSSQPPVRPACTHMSDVSSWGAGGESPPHAGGCQQQQQAMRGGGMGGPPAARGAPCPGAYLSRDDVEPAMQQLMELAAQSERLAEMQRLLQSLGM